MTGREEPEAPPAPRIVITFGGPDSATMTFASERVNPGQLYAAAWYLDAVARGQYADSKIAAAIEANARAELARTIRNGGRA